ncbi:MAG: DNA mismatch repair protein MutS [Defluviitaleaceae bacterium]|nr:DNA mismatch repair protein MutS [Defluviitaleaceae bacterium]
MRKEEFAAKIETHETLRKRYTAVSDVVGYIKLIALPLMGVFVYFLYVREFPLELVGVGVIFLIANIVLWEYHRRLHEIINFSKGIINIKQRHLDRISGKWTNFTDIGEEYINPNHPYSSDLDIVGQKSFFQFLNTTHTWYGREAFANDLLQPRYTSAEISERQDAIKELGTDTDFANRMEYTFSKIGVNNLQKFVADLTDQRLFLKSRVLKILLMFAPLVTIIFAVAVFLFRLEDMYIHAVTAIALQATVGVIGLLKTFPYLGDVSRFPRKLGAYSDVISALRNRDYNATILQRIQSQLGASEISAERAIKELGKISDMVSLRHNLLVWFALNALLMWDIQCSIAFEKWKRKYAHAAEGWFLALGEFESLLCFSTLPSLCDNTCLPTTTREKAIEAQNMGHPLISNEIRVNNNVSNANNIFIISGSNMSGKTTFMRAIGINLVLAQAGGFVCAKSMRFPLVEIITSMRIADDLNEGISTFYAELKRIKAIIENAEKTPQTLFLIDEIFRGTNSVDRLSGAKAVLTKLDSLGAIGIITTHDLDLCDITTRYPRIKNFSFSEDYRDNKIHFDYKLKAGKSTTTNARYLMNMLGITTSS